MGLDMYAFRHKGERIDQKTDRSKLEGTERQPILFADWRKHNRLQGFMQELYDEQNPDSSTKGWNDFNCVPLYLPAHLPTCNCLVQKRTHLFRAVAEI